MLTKLTIENFKRFGKVEIELGKSVVFIGRNNSGKTSALQALTLWNHGLKRWNAERKGGKTPVHSAGVTINQKDLLTIPLPSAKLLWKDLHVRKGYRDGGINKTKNININITVEGIAHDSCWTCGFEFDYANEASFYCRPLRLDRDGKVKMAVPDAAENVNVAYLPPMSGLAAQEFIKQTGEIGVWIGQGQTAQVLRNLCFKVFNEKPDAWDKIKESINSVFGIGLLDPVLTKDNSEIVMQYSENGAKLDLLAAGRGSQQFLLLLTHLHTNHNTILLLDEPDAHLEILRQRQVYQIINSVATDYNSQIIAASHSEIVLEEAAKRDVVIAFVGKPHRMDNRSDKAQLLKSLKDISYDQYLLAEETGWVLYLEGSTDLEIIRELARKLKHPAYSYLDRPFVHYVGTNLPSIAQAHFNGLREANNELVGIALFDRINKKIKAEEPLVEMMWSKREIENYICQKQVLIDYAKEGLTEGDMIDQIEIASRAQLMNKVIVDLEGALKITKKPSPWSDDCKVTDDFLDPLFEEYYEKLGIPNIMRKTNYHRLVKYVKKESIDIDITQKLDVLMEIAKKAKPSGTE